MIYAFRLLFMLTIKRLNRLKFTSNKLIPMADRPIGVTIVAALTMIFGVVLFFLLILFFGLSAVGGAHNPPISSLPFLASFVYFLYLFTPVGLSIFAFLVSSLMLNCSKHAWLVSMIFWVAFSSFFVWVYSFFGAWHWMFYIESMVGWYAFLSIMRILLLPTPFIYSAGSFIYFLTKTPRHYFKT